MSLAMLLRRFPLFQTMTVFLHADAFDLRDCRAACEEGCGVCF